MNDNLIDKVRKLFALANDTGVTEAERDNALSKASAIMLKYSIHERDLMTKEGEEEKIGYSKRGSWYGREYQMTIIRAVSHLYAISWFYDDKTFSFVGKPHFLQAAELTFDFLLGQVEMHYKANLPKGLTQRDRAKFRRHFKEACATRILHRVIIIVREYQTEKGAATLGTNALVVIDNRKQQMMEIQDFLSQFKTGRIKQTRPKHTEAALAGTIAGDHVQINQAVKP